MSDGLRLIITADANRTADGAAVPHAYQAQIDQLQRMGVDVHVFGIDDRTSPAGIARNIRELRIAISEHTPDLVVAYYGTMVAAISRKAAGALPLVVTFRGSDLQGSANSGPAWWLRDRLGGFLSRWAASGARRIIVNGVQMLELLPPRLRGRASNLPNGIDTTCFSPEDRDQAREMLGWSRAEKVILFNAGIGSGQAVKNRPLAEAVAGLLAQGMPVVRLEAMSGLPREQVAVRMSASDCLLVTSLHEGSPDLVKEAMACNLPVVSVPCGDVAERLQGVSPGGLAPYDTSALAGLVEEVFRDCRRSNGREQVFAQGLDIESATRRVLAVYRAALG